MIDTIVREVKNKTKQNNITMNSSYNKKVTSHRTCHIDIIQRQNIQNSSNTQEIKIQNNLQNKQINQTNLNLSNNSENLNENNKTEE